MILRGNVFAAFVPAFAKSVILANGVEVRMSGFTREKMTCLAGDQISWRNDGRESHELDAINDDGKFVGFFDGPLAPNAVSAVFTPSLSLDAKNKQQPYILH